MVPHPPRLVRNIDPTPFVAWLKLDPSDGWNSPPIRMAASIPKRSSNISGWLAPAPPISEFWLPFVDFIQELLGSGVCRDDRPCKWSWGAWLIPPGNLGGNHLWLLIPIASVSGYAVIRQLDLFSSSA